VSLKPRFMLDSVMPLKTLGFGAKPQLKVAAKFRFRHNQDIYLQKNQDIVTQMEN